MLNFVWVCWLNAGARGEEIVAELKTGTSVVCAVGVNDNFGLALAGFFALAMIRCLRAALTASDVGGFGGLVGATVSTIETGSGGFDRFARFIVFMVLLRVELAPVAASASSGRLFCRLPKAARSPTGYCGKAESFCFPFSGMRRSGGYEAFCFEYQPAIHALK
jgi:hypothetical protein